MTDAATIARLTPPDHFMCCICFEMFPVLEAYRDAEGQAWDMCVKDGEANAL